MEQYKTENANLEKELSMLREIVGGTWKKEDELKQLKSGMAALDRKIQLTLAPVEQQDKQIKPTDEDLHKATPESFNRISTVTLNVNDNRKTQKGLKL